MDETTVLYRPVGRQEFDLITASGYSAFPPRLPEQPIFYPVLNEEYVSQIAERWNARYNDPRKGYVTRFRVWKCFLSKYQIQTVGASIHQEYWIPAEELEEFNRNIILNIEVIAEYIGE